MLVYVVYKEILIGVGSRKLILAKHNWFLGLSLWKSLLLQQAEGFSGRILEASVVWPSSKVHGSTSEDVHKAHLLDGFQAPFQIPWHKWPLHFIFFNSVQLNSFKDHANLNSSGLEYFNSLTIEDLLYPNYGRLLVFKSQDNRVIC